MINKGQYKKWLDNIALVPNTRNTTQEVKEYPYCMVFHLMNTLRANASNDKSMAAILHPDRIRLSSLYMNPTYSKETKPLPEEKKEDKYSAVETTTKELASGTKNTDDLLNILQQRLSELKQDTAETGKNKMEEFLYEPEPSVSLDELVEKFNKFPPTISLNPADIEGEQIHKDLGKSSLQEKTNIVSETLAELYHSQKAYDKAIKIYEALMVKYPEKNATFAELIEKIKEEKKL